MVVSISYFYAVRHSLGFSLACFPHDRGHHNKYVNFAVNCATTLGPNGLSCYRAKKKESKRVQGSLSPGQEWPGLGVKKIRAHDGLRIRKNNSSKATKNAKWKSRTLEQANVGNHL
jgi:hypothetical protein